MGVVFVVLSAHQLKQCRLLLPAPFLGCAKEIVSDDLCFVALTICTWGIAVVRALTCSNCRRRGFLAGGVTGRILPLRRGV
jgi:hypothetical protein